MGAYLASILYASLTVATFRGVLHCLADSNGGVVSVSRENRKLMQTTMADNKSK